MRISRSVLLSILRIFLIISLLLALWGFQISGVQQGGDRIYLLDISDSFIGHLPQALEFIRKDARNLSPQDRAALLVFGKKTAVEVDLGPSSRITTLKEIQSLVDGTESHLEKALEFAASFQNSKRDFQILLLSDGKETSGKAEKWADQLSPRLYIKTFSFPLSEVVKIRHLQAPLEAEKGQYFWVRLLLQGKKGISCSIHFHGNGISLQKKITFAQEEEEVFFSLALEKEGFYTFQIEIPAFFIKKSLGLWCREKKRKILWAGSPFPTAHAIHFSSPQDLPSQPHLWAPYSVGVLENVPLFALTASQVYSLKVFVEKMGGGLLVLGGDQSFALGDYSESLLEEILPVWCYSQNQSNQSVSLLLLLDASGSMGVEEGNFTKWEGALERIFPLKGLKDQDRIGVICFSQGIKAVLEFQSFSKSESLAQDLRKVQPHGGTNLFSPLEKAFEMLSQEKSTRRHFLMITDGKSQERSAQAMEGLIKLHEKNPQISATFLAVGVDADQELLGKMAKNIKGKVISLAHFKDLQEALKKDLQNLRGETLYKKTFFPQSNLSGSPVLGWLEKIPFQALISTSLKPEAKALFFAPSRLPLLALWNWGLGKVAVFPTTLGKPWNPALEKEKEKFLRVVFPLLENKNLEKNFSLSYQFEEQKIFLEALFENHFLNGLNLEISLGKEKSFPLHQRAPGLYESSSLSLSPGLYPVVIIEKKEGIVGRSVLFVENREMEGEPLNMPLLSALGGKNLGEAKALPPLGKTQTSWDLFYFFTALALVLFILEEAIYKWR